MTIYTAIRNKETFQIAGVLYNVHTIVQTWLCEMTETRTQKYIFWAYFIQNQQNAFTNTSAYEEKRLIAFTNLYFLSICGYPQEGKLVLE